MIGRTREATMSLMRRASAMLVSYDTTSEEGRGRERERRVFLGSLTGVGARLVAAIASVISVPILLHYLGAERFGVWSTIVAGAAWLSLVQLGVAPTLLNRLSATIDEHTATRLTATAWWLSLAIAVVAALAFLPLAGLVSWEAVFNVSSAEIASEAALAAAAFWLGVCAATLVSVPLAVIRAGQRVYLANLIEIATAILRVGLLVMLVLVGASMGWLALAFAASGVLAATVGTVLILRPWASFHLKPPVFDRAQAATLLRTGASFSGVSVAALLIMYTDVIVISQALGPSAVPAYAVPLSLLTLFLGLELAILDAAWPALNDAASRGDWSWLQRTHRRLVRLLIASAAVFAVLIVTAGTAIVDLWAGPLAVPPPALFVVFALIALVQALELPYGRILITLQRVRTYMLIGLASAAVNLALSIVLVRAYGIIGVAIATLIAYLALAPILIVLARSALSAATAGSGLVANELHPTSAAARVK
jgi:O-antigen/teichoic acid export membrane protein